MEFLPLEIKGAYLVRPHITEDNRGRFVKPLSWSSFASSYLRTDFLEQYYSYSKRGVIRGMHFQSPPYSHAKLVYCAAGTVKDVLLDLRKNSDYGRYLSLTLGSETAEALYIPEGVAHGFATDIEPALMIYNVTSEYRRECDHGIRWNSFGFDWKIKAPIMSERDCNLPILRDFSTPFL